MSTCFEAFDHGTSVIQRFPGRAHGHQGRNKKGSPGLLSDLYEDLSKIARAAGGGGRLIESGDEEDGDSEARGAEQDADADSEMDDVTGVGDYEVKAGWHELNEPACTPELWSAMKEDYNWANKRVLPYGWDSSSFNHQLRDEDGELIHFFSLRAPKADVQPRAKT